MPKVACWLETTSPPSWNLAPPPVIEKLKFAELPCSTVKSRLSAEVLIDNELPSPVACTPLIDATTSAPLDRLSLMLPLNPPPSPSLITSTSTSASEP